MAIEKMNYVNVHGPKEKLNDVLFLLAQKECFHPDESSESNAFHVNVSDNPYTPLLARLNTLRQTLGMSAEADPSSRGAGTTLEQADAFANDLASKMSERTRRIGEINDTLSVNEPAKVQLSHLVDIHTSMSSVFSSTLKIRFGRLPRDSYSKLAYFDDKDFAFLEYDFDGTYYWGVYFATQDNYRQIDAIFSSLYFERVRIPDFVTSTPSEALEALDKQEAELRAELAALKNMSDLVSEEDRQKLDDLSRWAWYEQHIFDLEKYAVVLNDTFYLSGFIPRSSYAEAVDALDDMDQVQIDLGTETPDQIAKTPTKLKNGFFSRPFEGFVTMYGLPAYNDLDPTKYFSIVYALLFGIMFADLGQGLLLVIGGWLFAKKTGSWLGAAISRCGVVSALFGLLFGSVFGFEEALDPLYHAIGLPGKPLEVMAPESANLLLIAAVALGVIIIVASILFGVFSKLHRGQKGELLFSTNGLAGLLMYGSIVVIAVAMLVLKVDVLNPIFIVLCIVIPFLCMYFQEPLIEWANGHKVHVDSKVELVSQGFFEMFDVLITFASNTLSFLRVGGFVLAHAGMMSVVFTLAHMFSGAGSPIVIIFGNIFVMAMEGLIVGIQALRLGYYEMFSRFYDADGIPFEPLSLKKDMD